MSAVWDTHIHVFGDGEGCRMHWKLKGEFLAAKAAGFLADVPVDLNAKGVGKAILEALNGAKQVDKGVLLAFDYPHSDSGEPMEPLLYTPNDWVIKLCNNQPKTLFGASVHPYKPKEKWTRELTVCREKGAVLVKWIPSAQNILPTDPRCIPFYKKLEELGVALLCHVGDEHTIAEAGGDESLKAYNHPELLRPALNAGVTVIMAHCCLPIRKYDQDFSDNDFSEAFVRMMEQAEAKRPPGEGERDSRNLYADIAGLVSPFYWRSFMAKVMALRIPEKRLVLGSDYPIPARLSTKFRTSENQDEFDRIDRIQNPLDRNYEFLKLLGFSDDVMSNAANILKLKDE
jgi:predicted TIM-barrel fold metal-dependent hydrolase